MDPCDDDRPDNVSLCDLVLAANPTDTIATADCDGDGFTNLEECSDPNDPSDPEDPCDIPDSMNNDLCAAVNAAGEMSGIGMADCDMDGVSNWLECNPPVGTPPTDPEDPCSNPYTTGDEVCMAIDNGATGLIGVDCDGGGINDDVECNPPGGGTPTDPLDPCDDDRPDNVSLCDLVLAANPTDTIATADCDGDGFTNLEECSDPNDPSDPEDPCDIPDSMNNDLCAAVNAAGEMSGIGMADCDMDGVSNWLECNPPVGTPPTDPEDPCSNPYTTGDEVCMAIDNGATGLIGVDCDGGGINDDVECNPPGGGTPTDPLDPCDDMRPDNVSLCDLVLAANPTDTIATADCDGDGFTNLEECSDPNDPSDPEDPCDIPDSMNNDLCAAVNAAGEMSGIGMADCDMDGVSNWLECNPPVGTPPTDPEDPCSNPYTTGDEVCMAIDNGATGLIGVDCDGGGINDDVECNPPGGGTPTDPLDPCDDDRPDNVSLCDLVLAANPTDTIATADCDGDGFTNLEECSDPNDPSDPEDPCDIPDSMNNDLCAAVNAAGEMSGIGMADCDMDGVSNWLECNPPVGTPPTDPEDPCSNPYTTGDEVCMAIDNGATGLIGVDCDGGGINDDVECMQDGTDPLDPCDDVRPAGTDLCDLINAGGEMSVIGMADCDMDGVSNWLECNPPVGTPPTDPEDPCSNPYTTGDEVCMAIDNGATGLIGVDCDGGGINDDVECLQDGTDPLDPCDDIRGDMVDFCELITNAGPTSVLGMADCDGDGLSNYAECNPPFGPPSDPEDPCSNLYPDGAAICAAIESGNAPGLAMSDCDGGGIMDGQECMDNTDPLDPCDDMNPAGTDLCDLINAGGEMSVIGMADCDMDGVSNWLECNPPVGTPPTDPEDPCSNPYTTGDEVCMAIDNGATGLIGVDCDGGGINDDVECMQDGTDPLDPCDDVRPAGTDLCDLINAGGEMSVIGMADCDMDGVSNWLECNPPVGTPPTDPEDPCSNPYTTGDEVCMAIDNGATGLIGVDCDGGGINDDVECLQDGTDPLDPCDDIRGDMVDFCELITNAGPTSVLGMADCDGDGLSNYAECNPPFGPPSDPEDPCSNLYPDGAAICAAIESGNAPGLAMSDCDGGGIMDGQECMDNTDPLDPCDDMNPAGTDLCDLINAGGEMSAIGMADCDMDGVSNWLECNPPVGTPPTDPEDPCSNPYTTGDEVCMAIDNGATGLIGVDCDGGGIDDDVECMQDGTDPLDPCDDIRPAGTDLCDLINAGGEMSVIGMADCDMDGVSNWLECNPPVGTPPTDPEDPCSNPYTTGDEVCMAIDNGATGLIGVDCDGGGVNDDVECMQDGTDPLDPCDDLRAPTQSLCDIVNASGENSEIAMLDCDLDGVSNWLECNPPVGTPPTDPEDPCSNPYTTGDEVCAAITNGATGLANSDCDGGGVTDGVECSIDGTNPLIPCDDIGLTGADICNSINLLGTDSPFFGLDCDNGGILNEVECTNGGDPLDPSDDIAPKPDENVTYVDIPVTGDVNTNDTNVPAGSTYGNPTADIGNPSGSLPMINDDGTYEFVTDVPGVYTFIVEIDTPNGMVEAELIITVLDPDIDDNVPVANVDIASTAENTPVTLVTLSNDYTGNPGIALIPSSVMVAVNPPNGMVSVDPATGDITYTPDPGFIGTDTLTYTVQDADGNLAQAQQIITVVPDGGANSTSASDDNATTPFNTPVFGNVSTNDTDPEGDDQTITPQVTTIAGVGTLTLNDDGSYEFVPEDGYVGPVDFPYEVTDENGATAMATLHILVQPPGTMVSGFMWEDSNGNGIQDDGEPGIPGLMVILYDLQGDVVGVAVTDADGMYTFMNVPGDMYYYVEVDIDGTDLSLTMQDAGTDDTVDSDLMNQFDIITSGLFFLEDGETEVIDGGFYECTNIGDLVWLDFNENDIADSVENGINELTVNLYALIDGDYQLVQTTLTGLKPGTPSDDGWFNFCAPAGMTYYVEVVMPPLGLVQAVPNVGDDEEIDSDLTNAFGIGTTDAFTLIDGQDIYDIGAGFYDMATAGNRVWSDLNENGIQDSNEPSVSDVLVEAYEVETGEKVAEDVTNFSGTYSIEYLQKKDYYLKFTPPSGFGFTIPNEGGELVDSDVDHSFGYRTTAAYSMEPGENYINIDAGLKFGVLPVEWLDVSAENRGEFNLVSWKTALEVNTDRFVVERLFDPTEKFEPIGELDAAGESTELTSYNFKDEEISSGVHYYRIKQIDNDGTYTYSDIVSVDVKSSRNVVELAPNPAVNKSILTLSLNGSSDAIVKIIGNDGRLIRSFNVPSNGQDRIERKVDIENLPVGVYMVHVNQDEFTDVKRLIIIQ